MPRQYRARTWRISASTRTSSRFMACSARSWPRHECWRGAIETEFVHRHIAAVDLVQLSPGEAPSGVGANDLVLVDAIERAVPVVVVWLVDLADPPPSRGSVAVDGNQPGVRHLEQEAERPERLPVGPQQSLGAG